MATSSIHKPGWRSRRRSRLSLVERAVPRLGRSAEKGTKTAHADETHSPANGTSSNVANSYGVETKLALNGDAGMAPDAPLSGSDRDPASVMAPSEQAAALETISTYVSARSNDDTQMSSADDGTEPAVDAVVADEAEAPYRPSGTSDPASEEPALATVRSETSPPLAEASMVVTNLAAGIETGQGDAARSDEPAGSVGQTLDLDWDGLVDSGFTDPRDRSRPLSKNMDEIIRALVRQALSDQSSWRDRVILVTSPYDRMGKTTAAINFAFGLTTVANHHAVLVDVDTAGQGAVERLGGGDYTGIIAALIDEAIELDDVVIKTSLDRLTLVASGVADEETLDRFASRRMLQILRYLTVDPDTILVIDAPPILLSQEAAVLSVIAGQVVLAVEAGTTTGDEIAHALQRIGERHNVSLVLNECSGIKSKDAPRGASKPDPETAKRRSPGVKRRPSRVAAAAGVLGLCLLMLPVVGPAGMSSAPFSSTDLLPSPDLLMSSGNVLSPERCLSNTAASLVPCQWMSR